MAKRKAAPRKQKGNGSGPARFSVADLIQDKEYPILETSNGIELEIVGVSPFLMAELATMFTETAVPQYEQDPESVAEGDEPEMFDLDETVIEEEADPDRKAEFQELWDAYQEAETKRQVNLQNASSDLLFGQGLRIKDVESVQPTIDEWIEGRKKIGAEIPEDNGELQGQFIRLYALATAEDAMIAGLLVRQQSGDSVSQEDMETAVKSFRRQL